MDRRSADGLGMIDSFHPVSGQSTGYSYMLGPKGERIACETRRDERRIAGDGLFVEPSVKLCVSSWAPNNSRGTRIPCHPRRSTVKVLLLRHEESLGQFPKDQQICKHPTISDSRAASTR